MDVVKYGRVSSEGQDTEDKVSVDEQLADEDKLIERNDWRVLATFIDSKKYIKTKAPKKGKRVNPSGEYDDRPAFLEMLALVRTGQVDAVVCWRDDRLVRHPRVAVALEDALDEGDRNRSGKPAVKVFDANGSQLDRFTLGIKAQVWREENKRRAERIKLGKVGTLKQGLWPGRYNRLGYTSDKTHNGRGQKIILSNEDEVKTVQDIFNWYDRGVGVYEIRRRLIAQDRRQKGHVKTHSTGKLRQWNTNIIRGILRAEDYTGKATWYFNDGTSYNIEIPPIISVEQWERVNKNLDNGRRLSKRNTKNVYLLQKVLHCGFCDGRCSCKTGPKFYSRKRDNKQVRIPYKTPQPGRYECCNAAKHAQYDKHSRPYSWRADELDYAVWQYIVNEVVHHPDLIFSQVEARQMELRQQGENVESEITRLKENLKALEQDKMTFTRQLARGKISEAIYDVMMAENEETAGELTEELNHLLTLRDDQAKVKRSVDVAIEILDNIQKRLPDINQTPEELAALPQEKQREILLERQKVIRVLCDKVLVFADGRVEIEGLIDPAKSEHFEVVSSKSSDRGSRR